MIAEKRVDEYIGHLARSGKSGRESDPAIHVLSSVQQHARKSCTRPIKKGALHAQASVRNMLVSIFAAAVLSEGDRASADEDCCTPAITAKIAATTGFVDIAGIKLGMPAQQALNLIKAENAAFKTQLSNNQTSTCNTRRRESRRRARRSNGPSQSRAPLLSATRAAASRSRRTSRCHRPRKSSSTYRARSPFGRMPLQRWTTSSPD